MVYSPDIFPVVSKLVWNACFKAIMSLTSAEKRWSCEGGQFVLYGPEEWLQTVYGLEKGLANGPVKG